MAKQQLLNSGARDGVSEGNDEKLHVLKLDKIQHGHRQRATDSIRHSDTNTNSKGSDPMRDAKEMTVGKLTTRKDAIHLPTLKVKNVEKSKSDPLKKTHYKRSTSADQPEMPKCDPFYLAPIVIPLKKGFSSEDIAKSASDSALNFTVSATLSTHPFDPYRQRSSSTSLTQVKTPKISIDECPERGKGKEHVTVSTSLPISDSAPKASGGNLTPPIDRSKKFPRSFRAAPLSVHCSCRGMHGKNCRVRSVSRSMENMNEFSTKYVAEDRKLAHFRSNLLPSFPVSAPCSPKNSHKTFEVTLSPESPDSEHSNSFTSSVTVKKSQLVPRVRSQSARNPRQLQFSPTSPGRKLSARQTLPTLKLSVQEPDQDFDEESKSNVDRDEKLFLPRDDNFLTPGRLEIRSPPLTDYAHDW
ncbi:hypothetical protein HOLleu_10914 [Holothuria leucospilota]|uniref:Uncharacterized protein n=1 Tax=Holothuria leucospilota TaxID=206669 RepID=A0A9Q1HC06_HOLLE|nr:hypothetical protein HOLleu_10914 [Holothuria leucospilota]